MDLNKLNENLEGCKVNNLWTKYYDDADKYIDKQWDTLIYDLIKDMDFECVMDLACGKGRNSLKLVTLTNKLYCVDMNKYALDIAKEYLPKKLNKSDLDKITFIMNDGISISEIPDNTLTFIYQFDSGVHFSKEVISRYLKEFYRILKSGGKGFFHHSNYGNINLNDKNKDNFMNNPHCRTDMTKELFEEYCKDAGLICYKQQIIDWEIKDLDCLSFFMKQ